MVFFRLIYRVWTHMSYNMKNKLIGEVKNYTLGNESFLKSEGYFCIFYKIEWTIYTFFSYLKRNCLMWDPPKNYFLFSLALHPKSRNTYFNKHLSF